MTKVLMVACGLCAASAWAAWDPGEPVVTYWFGPGCPGKAEKTPPLTDTWAKQLKEGGFNTVWASSPEELDIAAKHGLRAIYSVDPTTEWAAESPHYAEHPVFRDDDVLLTRNGHGVNASPCPPVRNVLNFTPFAASDGGKGPRGGHLGGMEPR